MLPRMARRMGLRVETHAAIVRRLESSGEAEISSDAIGEQVMDALYGLDPVAYQAMSARSRQFAEYMFSPDSVTAATRAVYSSLMARAV